jgi:organic hydroperoxide reductase OsmC/OhrA
MENTFYYNTMVKWEEGRVGELSETGFPAIQVATPPDFPKGVPNIWSPEHVFVASANICLMTTFLAIAENSKLDFKSFECVGTGKLEKVDGILMFSEIVLKPVVVIGSEKEKEKTLRIIEKSEKLCLITNSMKTKVTVESEIIIKS